MGGIREVAPLVTGCEVGVLSALEKGGDGHLRLVVKVETMKVLIRAQRVGTGCATISSRVSQRIVPVTDLVVSRVIL